MSKVCDVCAKNKKYGNNVSHSNRKTRRDFKPNLQTVNIGDKKLKVCTKCIKTLGKTKKSKASE